MATAADVSAAVTEINGVGQTILATLETLDPATAPADIAAGAVAGLLAQLASKALAAWSLTSGTPITAESVQALMPSATPLTPPTAA